MTPFSPKSRKHTAIHALIAWTLGTALALLMAVNDCDGSEKEPHAYSLDQITAAVCAVESGRIYHGPGKVSGGWSVGDHGETGHWQISPMVLRDLRAPTPRTVVECESLFRRWYSYLLVETGSHHQALAAYHRGLRGRNRADAKAYAQRVLNYASTL